MINQHDPRVQSNAFSFEIWHEAVGAYDFQLARHAAKHYYAHTVNDRGETPPLQPRMLKRRIIDLKEQYEARHRALTPIEPPSPEDEAKRAANIARLRRALTTKDTATEETSFIPVTGDDN